MTNLNRWAPWYDGATVQLPYSGDELGYQAAAEWLDGLAVEDWGCGYAWFKRHHRGPYLGIDGTATPWCDIHTDLVAYRSEAPGLMMRGVLEHEPAWETVLDNAVASFTQRMCLIVFTPLVQRTTVIAEDVGGLGVPDISFALEDLTDHLVGCRWTVEELATATAYGVETVIRAEK